MVLEVSKYRIGIISRGALARAIQATYNYSDKG